MLSTAFASVQLAAEETTIKLPMAPVFYGIVVFAILMFLLLVTYAFKSVGQRHEAHAESFDPTRQTPHEHDGSAHGSH